MLSLIKWGSSGLMNKAAFDWQTQVDLLAYHATFGLFALGSSGSQHIKLHDFLFFLKQRFIRIQVCYVISMRRSGFVYVQSHKPFPFPYLDVLALLVGPNPLRLCRLVFSASLKSSYRQTHASKLGTRVGHYLR